MAAGGAGAQEAALSGVALCDRLATSLQEAGLEVERQGLVPAESSGFPQNLLVTLPPSAERREDAPGTIVFAFRQEFAYRQEGRLAPFIQGLRGRPLPYTAVILLSANDDSPRLPGSDDSFHPTGTGTYAAGISNTGGTCAIVVEEDGPRRIIPGGQRMLAPSWLVRALKTACTMHRAPAALPGSFNLLYTSGFVRENGRIAAFMSHGIPAAAITLGDGDAAILLTAADILARSARDSWDGHYGYLPLGPRGFWPGESFYALTYVLFAAAVLLRACFAVFARTGSNQALAKDLGRTWYFTPALLALTAATLHLAQRSLAPLLHDDPVLLVGLKLLAAGLVTFVIFVVQIGLDFRVSVSAAAMQMLLVAGLNVFIFSLRNIFLLFLFVMEYLAMVLAKNARKVRTILLTFLLPPLIFAPYMANFLYNADAASLRGMAEFSIAGDILLACMLHPLQLQWSRLMAVTGILGPHRRLPPWRYAVYGAAAILLSLGGLAAMYFPASRLLAGASESLREEPPPAVLMRDGAPHLSIGYAEEGFMELSIRHLTVSSALPVIRYEVAVEGAPVYDSNYDYGFTDGGAAMFRLPDHPGAPVQILYSADAGARSTIMVAAFLRDGADILHEAVAVATGEGL